MHAALCGLQQLELVACPKLCSHTLRGRGSEQGSCAGGASGRGTQGKGLGMVGAGQPVQPGKV